MFYEISAIQRMCARSGLRQNQETMTADPDPSPQTDLNDRQRRFVGLVASGQSLAEAARSAGFSRSYARKANHLLMKHPAIARAIAAIRAEARTASAYTVIQCMREANDAAAFAKANKQSMALVRAVELRARLSGLLIDRVEVVNVDLRGALERAESRIVNVTNMPLAALAPVEPLPLPAKQSTRWAARIAGDQHAGPVAGESETSA